MMGQLPNLTVRASLADLAYAKSKIHLAYRPKKSQQRKGQMGKGQIFFDIQLQYHLKCKIILQLNGIKKKKLKLKLILSNRFNRAISLSSHFFSFFSLSSFSLTQPLSLSRHCQAFLFLTESPSPLFSPNHQAKSELTLDRSSHVESVQSPVLWGLWFCCGRCLKWVL